MTESPEPAEHQHSWSRLDITEPGVDPGWEVCTDPGCHAKRYVGDDTLGRQPQPGR